MIKQLLIQIIASSASVNNFKTKEISEFAEWNWHFWTRTDIKDSHGFVLLMLFVLALSLYGIFVGKRHLKKHDKIIVTSILLLVTIQLFKCGLDVLGLIALLFFFLLTYLCLKRNKDKHPTQIEIKSLFKRFFLVWLSGYIIYFVGFFVEGTNNSALASLIRPALSSIELFLSHSDLLEVADNMKENQWFMLAFTCVYFSAIYTSLSFILEFVSYRMDASWRMHIAKKRQYKTLYIFVNGKEHVEDMAQDIYKHHQNKGDINNIKFLFLESIESDSNNVKRINFTSIIESFVHRKDIYSLMYKYNGIVGFYEASLSNIESKDGATFFKNSGMSFIPQLIRKTEYVKLFFFSEDEKQNINYARAIIPNVNQLTPVDKRNNIEYYIIAQKNALNEILEMNLSNNIRIVDPSLIAISFLQNNIEYQPVNFVEIEPDCTVSSEFNALLVGFGEIGRNALKYLYEFGAFVDSKKNDCRSPFHCAIFDKNMKINQSLFEMHVPSAKDNPLINFYDSDAYSEKLWNWFEQKRQNNGRSNAESLNYIIVALGNDDTNISIAIEIYKLLIRLRNNNLRRLKIFVCIYKRENIKRLDGIVSYYNEMNKDSNGEIILFGKSSEIFTYDRIVNHRIYKDAIRFYEKYNELNANTNISWEERHKSATNYGMFVDNLRKESQDIANVYHIKTKLMLFGGDKAWSWIYDGKVMPNATVTDYQLYSNAKKELESVASLILTSIKEGNSRRGSFNTDITYIEPSNNESGASINVKMLQLARTEHIRWVASHEMLGYVNGETKNALSKTHPCINTWSKLNDISQSEGCYQNDKNSNQLKGFPDYELYDYIVVETSLILSNECSKITDVIN